MTHIAELFEKWDEYAEKVEESISTRNYKQFRLTMRKGKKCFNEMKEIIESGTCADELEQKKDSFVLTVRKWDKLPEKLQPWMEEIKEKINRRKTAEKKDKKLSTAYNYMKKTGLKLRINAK